MVQNESHPTTRRAASRKGLVLVNTGDGKGKTTAALGVILRSWGQNFRVCVIQFIKGESDQRGEVKAVEKMGIEWHVAGDGYTWRSKDMNETAARACRGWQLAQEKITAGSYDLVVLDEFTYPLYFGWLKTAEVIEWLRGHKPDEMHLVITGRYAPVELIDYADLVTEMNLVKHPFTQGVQAQAGIEF